MDKELGAVASFVRAMVRPTVTWGLAGVVAYLGFRGQIGVETFLALVGPILGYWFASRKPNGDSI